MEQIIPGSRNGRKGAITQLSPKPNTPEAAAVKHAAISTGAKSVAICVYCGAIVKFIGRSAQFLRSRATEGRFAPERD